MNAYDIALGIARLLQIHFVEEVKHHVILRLTPLKDGVGIVCEPGPDPVVLATALSGGIWVVFYDPETGQTFDVHPDSADDFESQYPGHVRIPLRISNRMKEAVYLEAEDGVTLAVRPKTGTPCFPEII